MSRRIKLNDLHSLLTTCTYPISTTDLASEFEDVTLVYADGDEPFDAVLDRVSQSIYHSPGDLEADVFANLPVEAVGEPGQAEGEG